MRGEAPKTITVKAKPGARISALEVQADGTWLAHVKAQPVDGKANEELIRLVAEAFSVTRSAVTIKRGTSGRHKVVVIDPR